MTFIKFSQPQKTFFIALAFVGAYCTLLPSGNLRVQAQSTRPEVSTATRTFTRLSIPGQTVAQLLLTNSNTPVQQPKHSVRVQVSQTKADPKPEGAPEGGTRQDAGTRSGQCPRVDKPLTALVPITQKTTGEGQSPSTAKTTSQVVLGLTAKEHPTFWFYVPYALTSSHPIEFVLQDDKGNDIYQTKFIQSETSAGVVGFELPSTAPPLEVNKIYRWYFLVYCNAEDPAFVDGWVQRVPGNPSLYSALEQATPQEIVTVYTNGGIWYEAVTSLARLRTKNPEDATLRKEWANLLESINLEAIAPEPITTMLTPKQ
jgi:hypothetical protein